jgi:CelD/BcsL family acetyltransferase involved in cellulose biosynthesis
MIGDRCSGSEYPDIVVDVQHQSDGVDAVLDVLLRQQQEWDCIWLPHMSGWTGGRERIEGACAARGFHVRARSIPFSNIPLPSQPETYLDSLSSNARSMIRRRTREVFSAADVKFERCHDASELQDYLNALFELNDRRWSLRNQRGTFVRKPSEARFYETFAPVALSRSWLRFYALRVGKEIKAVQAGYVYHNTFHQMQEGFDPAFMPGAGNVLRSLVLQDLIEEGVTDYDFLGGFTEHKRRWGAQPRTGCNLWIGRRSLLNQLIFGVGFWPTGRYIRDSA